MLTIARFPLAELRPELGLLPRVLYSSPENQWIPLPFLGLLPRPRQPLVDLFSFVAEGRIWVKSTE